MYKAFSFLLLGVLISVALMSFWSPYVGDDYIWLFASHGSSFPVGTGSAGGSAFASAGMFARILEMVGIHYMTLNGRILSNFFCGMFGAMSAAGYACCNAVVFVLLVYLIWRMSGLKERWQPIVVFFLVALLVRHDAVLWRSATSNYLWPAVCALALALLWERMERGVRVWQFGGLVFVAFLTAGGHELIDFGVCTMLLVYWIVYWVRRHRLPLDGRMALSCGCVLGSLSLVFAPGTLRRAGGAGAFDLGGSLLFSTAAFMRALLRCLVDCPPLAVVIGVVMWMFVRRRWNWFVGRRHSYPLICWAVVLFFTCFLTDGVGRTSWLLSAASLFVLFVMAGEYELHFSDRFVRVCSVLSGIVAVGVVTLSCCQAYAAKSAYDAMLEKWRDDSDGFFVGRQWVLSKGLGWFDRTARLDSLLHFGAGYPNHLVARSYGRTHLIRVTEDMRRSILASDGILSDHARIPGALDLHSADDVDLIAIPYGGGLPHGAPIRATISYRRKPELSFLERVRLRITREGATEACKNSPMEDMCGSGKQDGFIYKSAAHGVFAVVVLNRGVPRDMIVDVQVEPCPVPPREAVLL